MYIVYGVESLCKSSFTVRNLIGWRTESDRVANAIGGKTKETTAPNKVLWFP